MVDVTSRRLRRSLFALCALVAAAAILAVFAPPARADATTGSLQFILTDYAGGGASSGGCMQVYNSAQAVVGSDCVGAAGTYRVDGLAPATYKVKFANFTGAAPTQWYYRASTYASGTSLSVAAGSITSGQYTLLQPNSFAGLVVNGGVPVTGGYVEVWAWDVVSGPVARVAVDADGRYATGSLSCTTCRVRFGGFPGLADQWLGNTPSSSNSLMASPSPGFPQIVGLSFNRGEAVMNGIIATPANFVSGGACVILYENTGRALQSTCGSPGDPFQFRNLGETGYSLCVVDSSDPAARCAGNTYLWDFVGGGTINTADRTTFQAGQTKAVPVAFGGTIVASPKTVMGDPASGGCMDVRARSTGALLGSDCAGAGGTFSVPLGVDDAYVVLFRDFPGRNDQWYSGKASLATATLVGLASGATRSLDPVVLRGPATDGSIDFAVTDWRSGAAATGGCMQVYDESGTQVAQDCSPFESHYVVQGLAEGYYRVLFSNFTGEAPTQWYGATSAMAFADAGIIAIGDGLDFSGAFKLLPPWSIAGTARDGSDNPLSGGWVDVWLYDYPPVDIVATVPVAADGTYATRPLPECVLGCQVRFRDFDGKADQWYVAVSDPTEKTVATSGATGVRGVDGHLDLAEAVVSGTMTLPPSSAGGTACVLLFTGSEGVSSAFLRGTVCGNEGDPFEFRHIEPGMYHLCLGVTSASCPFSQREFTVVEGQAFSAPIVYGGTLTAHVTLADGSPASEGCVEVYDFYGVLLGSDCVGDAGTFTVTTLEDANATVRFHDFLGGVDEWYNDVPRRSIGSTVVLVQGSSASISAQLAPWGSIAGTVTLPGGAPGAVCVLAYDEAGTYSDGPYFAPACTEPSTGEYRLDVPPGSYRVRFFAAPGTAAWEWYPGVASADDATVIRVSSGATTTADVDLVVASSVSGRVSLTSGGAASDFEVQAYSVGGALVETTRTDSGGHYVFDSLMAGTYTVRVEGKSGWGSVWFADAQALSDASPIATAPGQPATANLKLQRVGTISGKVAKPGGAAARHGCARIYEANGGDPEFVKEACADSGGNFSVQVPPGTYKVLYAGFDDGAGRALGDEWSSHKVTFTAADSVTVTAGATTVRNSELALGAAIEFTTTGATGGCVQAFNSAHQLATEHCFGNSSVNVVALPGGWWEAFHFYGFTKATGQGAVALHDVWYGNHYAFDDAWQNAIPVYPPSAAPEGYYPLRFDVGVPESTSISGTVTAPPGVGLDGWVAAYGSSNSGPLLGWSPVAADGTYRIDGLPAGASVRIGFHGFSGGADRWFISGSTFGSAEPLLLYGPEYATAVVNATLTPESVISGFLGVPASFNGSFACVTAWYSDGYFVNEFCGAPGEAYALHRLPAGTYHLEFTDEAGGTAPSVWFDRKSSWDLSTGVDVGAGVTVPLTPRWGPPVVKVVAPQYSLPAGGRTAVLMGSGFATAAGVTFGGVPATNVVVLSDARLQVTVPAHAVGTVNVVVTNSLGSSTARPFTYLNRPFVGGPGSLPGACSGATSFWLKSAVCPTSS